MKQQVTKLITNPIITGSAIMVIGSLFASGIHFLFNIVMIRNLSEVDMGVLYSLISIFMLFTMPAASINPTVVRFAASYFAKNEYDLIRGLFIKVSKLCGFIGLVIFLSFIIFSQSIGNFFNIHETWLIILTGVGITIMYVSGVTGALLQAKLAFSFIVISNFLAAIVKLGIGTVLVLLGFRVVGAMWGYVLSLLIGYFISFYALRFLLGKSNKTPAISFMELFSYGAPAAFTLLGTTALISIDVLLVKHFFPADQAGLYSGLSVLGKIIYFLTAPISSVMFPMVVQRHEKNESYYQIFLLSLVIVLLPSLAATFAYFLFPKFFIILIVKRAVYLPIAPYLGIFGVFMTIFSLLMVMTNYFLAIKKVKILYPVLFAALVQFILIWFFHNSFTQIITWSIMVSSLLLISFLLYYLKIYGAKKTN